MFTLYLRPIAVFGAAAIAVSAAYNINNAMNQQQPTTDAAPPPPAAPQSQASLAAGLAAFTWVVVVYTRCMPIIFLGLVIGAIVVLMHAGLRQSPSEMRYRGRLLHSYTFYQVIGREPVPAGSDARLVFTQIGRECWKGMVKRAKGVKRWAVFYILSVWDIVRKPFIPALRSAPLPTGWN